MTRYVNVGAFVFGARPKSKKALRTALVDTPDAVTFDTTSMFDAEAAFTPETLPEGVALSVVGPDPYSDRRWYATVTRDAYHRVTCK